MPFTKGPWKKRMAFEAKNRTSERRKKMAEFIDIEKENGELIMRNMETALGFQGWNLLCAKYDARFKNIRVLYSCEKDTDIYIFHLKMKEDGKLIAYAKRQFSPELFPEILIQYFDPQRGYTFTAHEERFSRIFQRVMTPELALQFLKTGMEMEWAARGVK